MIRSFFTRPAQVTSSANFYISDKAARNTCEWWAKEGSTDAKILTQAERTSWMVRNNATVNH